MSLFSTDMQWEIGYDQRWFTFWARLHEQHQCDEVSSEERAAPIFEVGTDPYECATVDELNRALAALTMSVPLDVAAALSEEQQRHLAGQLGEPREMVEQRLRMVRHVTLVQLLKHDVQPMMGRPMRRRDRRTPRSS